jgi:hypothetical protein
MLTNKYVRKVTIHYLNMQIYFSTFFIFQNISKIIGYYFTHKIL